MGDRDPAVQTVGAGEELEIERTGIREVAQHRRDGDPAGLGGLGVRHVQSGSISP
jgi:hypothetical protein